MVITIGFWQCAEPDLEVVTTETESGVPFGKKQLSVKKVDVNTVSKDPKIQKTLQNIAGKSFVRVQPNGRVIDETGYFKLQMTDIVMVEKGSYTSYTFAVTREEDREYMENIIVNLYADGSMKTYFVEYEFSEAEKNDLENEGIIPSELNTRSYLMDNLEDVFVDNNLMRISMVSEELMCPEVTITQVPNTCPFGHDFSNYQSANNGGGCSYYNDNKWNPFPPFFTNTVVTYVPCGGGGSSSGSTGGDPSGGSPSGGGEPGGGGGSAENPGTGSPQDSNPSAGGSSGDDTNPSDPALVDEDGEEVITVPVVPDERRQTPHEKNCTNLQDLISTSKQNIVPIIDFMEGKLDQNTKNEFAASFKNTYSYDEDTNTNTVIYSNEYEQEGTPSSAQLSLGTYYFGGIHIHPKSNGIAGALFSWLDLRTTLEAYQYANGTLKNKVTLMLIAPDPQDLDKYNLYSLRIENVTNLINKLDEDWNDPSMSGLTDDQKINTLNDALGNDYIANSGNVEKFFLEEFSDYGISLYKGDPDSDYQNWDKLELEHNIQSNIKTVVKNPCN
uniref:hypothetical protein n=2 Tax=Flavobacterium sp. TaxID=239 RepID=UPI00404A92BE